MSNLLGSNIRLGSNIGPGSNIGSMGNRAEVLRELNLYPLWQLRGRPAATKLPEAAEKKQEEPASSAKPLLEPAGIPESIGEGTEHLNWSQLKKRVTDCTACELRSGCIQTIFGTGDKEADWLFVGSWPSEDDETKGEPFAGQAGQLLDNMLAAIGLKRGENVYLVNVVKCSGSIKRSPQRHQIDRCSPYLIRQIQLIQPRIIVVLGHAAATAMLGVDSEWNSLIGKVHDFSVLSKDDIKRTIPLIITHHPAALLLAPANKAQTWRDLCLARNTMQVSTD